MISPDAQASTLTLRTIGDLDGKTFHVPRYQRGYRWNQTQVEALLNDLFAWSQTNPQPTTKDCISKAPAYCLQPLVVAPRDESAYTSKTKSFDVVDDQQRLTTLYFILENLPGSHSEMPHFTLRYERHTDDEGGTRALGATSYPAPCPSSLRPTQRPRRTCFIGRPTTHPITSRR